MDSTEMRIGFRAMDGYRRMQRAGAAAVVVDTARAESSSVVATGQLTHW
jgi:hypothetical protein